MQSAAFNSFASAPGAAAGSGYKKYVGIPRSPIRGEFKAKAKMVSPMTLNAVPGLKKKIGVVTPWGFGNASDPAPAGPGKPTSPGGGVGF